MTISRRRILSGLIAAPAVLVLGAHMPVRMFAVQTEIEWFRAELDRELLKLLRLADPIRYTPKAWSLIARVTRDTTAQLITPR